MQQREGDISGKEWREGREPRGWGRAFWAEGMVCAKAPRWQALGVGRSGAGPVLVEGGADKGLSGQALAPGPCPLGSLTEGARGQLSW